MSLKIIKPGLLDTIQDQGRYGQQHLGINPGGAMDRFASQLANAVLGKDLSAAVLEIHFPSPKMLFEKETVICITGSDFSATVNKKNIPVNKPVVINTNTVLQFDKKISGARCYLATLHDLDIEKWLGSYSTNLIASTGGLKGKELKKDDIINFKNQSEYNIPFIEKDFVPLPWKAAQAMDFTKQIRFVKGPEWDWLDKKSIRSFTENMYTISNTSNRMGYRLQGNTLNVEEEKQLISSGVTFGTIQLLPEGQLIILMADHQTTGGYPRIGNVITADLPLLAQKNPGDKIKFTEVEIGIAQNEFLQQQKNLLSIKTASKFNMEKLYAN